MPRVTSKISATMTSYPKTLSIDIETYSSVSLAKSGVYRYVESPDFEILLFGYSVDEQDVQVVDIANGEKIPPAILSLLADEKVTKFAFNANFERVCLSKFIGLKTGEYLDPSSWRCTMIWAAYLGFPLSLEQVGLVLNIDKQKLSEGRSLIRYFSVPTTPTKANEGRRRNYPYHDKAKWAQFREYNKRDVEVELEIKKRFKRFTVRDFVWDEYILDQRINDCGVLIDTTFVRSAIKIDESKRAHLLTALKDITNVENPNSVMQIKEWLNSKGVSTNSLDKASVSKLRAEYTGTIIDDALELRQQLSKSSVRKYQAMENVVCKDNRVRGMFQFYGANRTGRWAGRLVQLQNLPRNSLKDLTAARTLVKEGNQKAINALYENIPDVLSQLIRTSFIPVSNKRFIVSDFSAIEARVLAWYANEVWRLEAFMCDEDIYCASASQMFNVEVKRDGPNAHLRDKGKIAELALGYGGSIGALKAMGALEAGLTEDELLPLVKVWRYSNARIVQFWWDIHKAVIEVIKERTSRKLYGLTIRYESGLLIITLPSKRSLYYVKPQIGISSFGNECVTYEGVGPTKKWDRIESYGPKFVENITQATARDLLSFALENLSDYKVVMHVHDEIVIEAEDSVKISDITTIMSKTPAWAKDLILKADGYETPFYKKD